MHFEVMLFERVNILFDKMSKWENGLIYIPADSEATIPPSVK